MYYAIHLPKMFFKDLSPKNSLKKLFWRVLEGFELIINELYQNGIRKNIPILSHLSP
jgi:hypothetical protein